ncbi:MAG: Flp family type IVb pilin [Erythrobacter sp.]|nr:Flp family type IVb pilin [Erythrobacter sp.]
MFARKFFQRLLRDTQGATAIEYGLIASLIVVAMITAMGQFANSSSNMWGIIEGKYRDASTN